MKKVLLGMSGGVDSSVAAYLLKKAGYDVVGLYFTITDKAPDLTDLKAVCAHLDLPFVVRSFKDIFDQKVLDPFIREYSLGNTPNICVGCNTYIKFGALLEEASRLGCDYIATGHYCEKTTVDGVTRLKMAADKDKDQTYFLHGVSTAALERTLFPLGGLTKEDVRRIARENSIPTAQKKDSSDVCLAEGGKFSDFIGGLIPPCPGDIITVDGERVGRHKGLHTCTLGQRRGLNLGGKSGEDGRWFVVDKDPQKNAVIVAHGSEDLLFKTSFTVSDVNFIGTPPRGSFDCFVKTRYRAALKPCTVTPTDGGFCVRLFSGERAITLGQYAVFYDGDLCLGGGRITSVAP